MKALRGMKLQRAKNQIRMVKKMKMKAKGPGRKPKGAHSFTVGCKDKERWKQLASMRTGGLFLVVHPNSGIVLALMEMLQTELLDTKVKALYEVLHEHPSCNCIIHDE